jgi:hypothetical protein
MAMDGGFNNNGDDDLKRRFDAACAPLERSVGNGLTPGGVLGIVDLRHGRITAATGSAAIVPERRPMTLATWFDLASVSKVLFTTPRILAHHAAGRIDLDAPLTSVIPDLRQYTPDAWERKVTFRQCLGHQTPFPNDVAIFTFGESSRLLRNFVLQYRWHAVPSAYTCVNFILLGIALERLEGKSIREMDPGPGFAFSAAPEQAAATEFCTWRNRMVVGEVHDENCAALEGAGNAGLFGTIDSVLDAAEALLRGDCRRRPLGAAAAHSPRGDPHPRLGTPLCGLGRRRPREYIRHRPHRLHRHRPVARFRQPARLGAADQSRASEPLCGQRYPATAPRRRRCRERLSAYLDVMPGSRLAKAGCSLSNSSR